MNVRLPNGKIIRGVPDGTPKEEVMRRAVQSGIATESDFQSAAASMTAAESPAAEPSSMQEQNEAQSQQEIPLFSGDASSLEEIGAAPEMNEFSAAALRASAAANLIYDEYLYNSQYPSNA